ncbi:MAG TPA: hypothetical protein VIL84_15595 [Devosiaceae bacterium]
MSEQEYDITIAPVLLDLAEKCERLGMRMVARVEWGEGAYGITQTGASDGPSAAHTLAVLAAHANGNFDGLCIALLKSCDCSASMILHQYQMASRG